MMLCQSQLSIPSFNFSIFMSVCVRAYECIFKIKLNFPLKNSLVSHRIFWLFSFPQQQHWSCWGGGSQLQRHCSAMVGLVLPRSEEPHRAEPLGKSLQWGVQTTRLAAVLHRPCLRHLQLSSSSLRLRTHKPTMALRRGSFERIHMISPSTGYQMKHWPTVSYY